MRYLVLALAACWVSVIGLAGWQLRIVLYWHHENTSTIILLCIYVTQQVQRVLAQDQVSSSLHAESIIAPLRHDDLTLDRCNFFVFVFVYFEASPHSLLGVGVGEMALLRRSLPHSSLHTYPRILKHTYDSGTHP